jgi:hydroxymethylpyrimidine pyrophosphatase-like HAD family hydrolase
VHLSGIPQNRVVLFGDGHNDLDAMIHLPEALCCCPANATPGVQQVVLQRRGHISSKKRSQGVLEILTESIEPWLKNEKIK